MFRFICSLISLQFLVMLCGCMPYVDYTGQKFPATPESSDVKFLHSRNEIDLDEYAIIGRFIVTADAGSDKYTFQKELLAKAREFGGDAVCQIDYQVIRHGAYTMNEEEFGAPVKSAVTPAVDPSQRGAADPLAGEKVFVKRKRVRALLLKKRTDVKKLLQ